MRRNCKIGLATASSSFWTSSNSSFSAVSMVSSLEMVSLTAFSRVSLSAASNLSPFSEMVFFNEKAYDWNVSGISIADENK